FWCEGLINAFLGAKGLSNISKSLALKEAEASRQSLGALKAKMVSEKLSEIPGLKPYLEKLMRDPEVPMPIRKTIQSSLERPDVTVAQLNQELRDKYLIHQGLNAFHAYKTDGKNFSLVQREGSNELSFNAQASNLSTKGSTAEDSRTPLPLKTTHGVYVQDRP